VTEDEEESVHHHSRVRVQRLTRVTQPVFLPAIISLSAAACLPSCNYQPISRSLSSFLQLSAYQLHAVFLPAIISLLAAACPLACNYQPFSCSLSSFLQLSAIQLQPVFLPAIIRLSAAACLPSCNYQSIRCSLSSFLQLSDFSRGLSYAIISCQLQPVLIPAFIGHSSMSFLQLSA
jgi:hypothetical protein